MAIEIVDLPSYKMVDLSSSLCGCLPVWTARDVGIKTGHLDVGNWMFSWDYDMDNRQYGQYGQYGRQEKPYVVWQNWQVSTKPGFMCFQGFKAAILRSKSQVLKWKGF
jgi:hypothetical protein